MSNHRKKISIIGAGFVGSACTSFIMEKRLGDVVLIDINEDMARGKALDFSQASPIEHFDAGIVGGSDYALTAGSDVVVITAGLPRKAGMKREDLLSINSNIVRECTQQAVAYSPDCVLIVVTNPLDAMCHIALEQSNFPRERVIGMSGILDSARFRTFIAQELGVSPDDVQAFVFGSHGDSMVPMPGYASVGGIPLCQLLSREKIIEITTRTKNAGTEIVNLLKTGSASYTPGASIAHLVESIVTDRKRYLPCSVFLNGEYGINGLYCGVVAKIGASGIEDIPRLQMSLEERARFESSASVAKEQVDLMRELGLYGPKILAPKARQIT